MPPQMSCHKTLLADVAARIAACTDVAERSRGRAAPAAPFTASSSPDDRILLASFVLHTADLCNPLFPPPVSKQVAMDLSLEFEAQAAQEKALGLPVSVMTAPDGVAKARGELSFIRYVVSPLYRVLVEIAPAVRPCLSLIDANVAAWDAAAGRASSSSR